MNHNRIVISFNYVKYSDKKKALLQDNAITVLSKLQKYVNVVSINFKDEEQHKKLYELNITQINALSRDSLDIPNNNRRMPYVKDFFNTCYKIDCDVFGYINSDILVPDSAIELLYRYDFDAYVFSRSDTAEVTPEDFQNNNIRVIFGGNSHCGADGFFFKKSWWDINKDKFPNDFIMGECEWDTSYRYIINHLEARYLDARVLYHVYHDAIWKTNSIGGMHNDKIWNSIKNKKVL